jgi:HEAT repeat protein
MSRRSTGTLALAAALVAADALAAGSIQPNRPGRRWALVVSTGAARSHAESLERTLSNRYGFAPDRLVALREPDVTAERIFIGISSIQEKLEPYDVLFVFLAMEQREDPSAGLSFLPSDLAANEPWRWIPARRVFGWLSALPVGSALVMYAACPSAFDAYLAGELAYATRPGAIDLLMACESPNPKRTADARSADRWRGRLTEQLAGILESQVSRQAPTTVAQLADLLEQALPDSDMRARRVPEHAREGFVFEPTARTVTDVIEQYQGATSPADREAALRNLPGIVKTPRGDPRESQRAVQFLRDVALSPTARVQAIASLQPQEPLALRSIAVEALGELRTDGAQDAVGSITQQAHDSPWIRRAALTQLTRLPPREKDLVLIRPLLEDDDASVREAAVRALVVLNDKTILPVLARRLELETDTSVRIALLQVLPTVGWLDRALAITLLNDGVPTVRAQAATTLARLGHDSTATMALLERLGAEDTAEVRSAVAAALSSTCPPGDQAVAAQVTRALLAALQDGPGSVRPAAANSLGIVGGPGAADALRRLLSDGKELGERAAAAEALGRLKSADAIPDLERALQDDNNPALRPTAAAALGAIGTPTATAALIKVLDDRDPYVQSNARRALEKIPISQDRVILALRDESPDVRLAAVRRISTSKEKDPQALKALVDLLQDPVLEVREAAATELIEHGDSEALGYVFQSGRSAGGSQLSVALSVLARVPEGRAAETLVGFVRDAQDSPLLVEGMVALGEQAQRLRLVHETSPSEGSAALLSEVTRIGEQASRHESSNVRWSAVPVLGATPAGRQRLEEMARADPSKEVRSAAIEQLRFRGASKR